MEDPPKVPDLLKITAKEIANSGSEEAVKIFKSLSKPKKRFCQEYLVEQNASRAYKIAQNNHKMSSAVASACGYRYLNDPNVKAFLDTFLDRRVEAYYQVTNTWMDMMQAKTKEMVQKEDGTWERGNEVEDWKVRKWGAEGVSKLYGFNEEKSEPNEKGSINQYFTNNFNTYLESKGEKPVEIESEDAEFKNVSEYAQDFKKFSSKS